MVDYWPLFDKIALYGQFVPNLTIVLCAIYFNVSFFMGFNVVCICAFYSI